jgi:hypothetical protein
MMGTPVQAPPPAGSTGPGRRRLILYVAIFIALLGFPSVATLYRGFRKGRPSSLERFPSLTLSRWLDGSFQSESQAWFDDHNAVRSFLVRIANQINFSLFREVSYRDRTGLILGKNNSLFLSMYIEAYFGRWAEPASALDRFASDLRRVQDRLKSRGVTFLFLLTPSKASINAEEIPDDLVPGGPTTGNYEILMPLLARHGVETLDGRALALELKKKGEYPLFPRSGHHWNSYCSYRVSEAVISRLEGLMGKSLNHLRIEKVEMKSVPEGGDDDLSFQARLFWPSVFYGLYPYPVVSREAVPEALVPNVYLVGDSFLELPRHWLMDFGIVSSASRHDWYFQRKIDPEQEIFTREVVILGMNEGLLGWLGYGFIETVLTGTYLRKPG